MSKTIIKHYGKIIKGKMVCYNESLYQETIYELEGKEFELIIKEKSRKASTDAHGYYRAGIIGECLKSEVFGGWDREEIHDHFASLFLTYVTHEKALYDGKTIFKEVIKKQSTADLNSKEMFEYCEKCIRWCAQHEITIHTPEQYHLSKFKTIEKT